MTASKSLVVLATDHILLELQRTGPHSPADLPSAIRREVAVAAQKFKLGGSTEYAVQRRVKDILAQLRTEKIHSPNAAAAPKAQMASIDGETNGTTAKQ